MANQVQTNDELHQEMIRYLQTWAESEEQFPIDFDKVWKWLGYSRKDSAKRNLISVCDASTDYQSTRTWTSTGGTNREVITLSHRGFEHFCLSSQTDQGRQVRAIFIDIKNRHLALRDAIQRGDVELRVNQSAEPDFGGYIDARHEARAKAICAYKEQKVAMVANPITNNRSQFINTNSLVSRAALGMLPCRLKEELHVSNSVSSRDYMDAPQLHSVAYTEDLVQHIATNNNDAAEYKRQLLDITNTLYELNKQYGIHGYHKVARLTVPQLSDASNIHAITSH